MQNIFSNERLERLVSLLLMLGILGVLLQVPALIVLCVLPLVVILMAQFLQRRVLRPITYRRRIDQSRMFVGEKLHVTSEITNDSRLPVLSLEVFDQSPKGFNPTRDAVEAKYDGAQHNKDFYEQVIFSQAMSLKSHERVLRHFNIQPLRRGYFNFPQPILNATELFGLFEDEQKCDIKDAVLVYPQVFDLDEIGIPTRSPIGSLPALRRLIEDPSRNIGVRDYQYGDSFRNIHWKATAHRNSLQTRIYEQTSQPTAMILLNVTTFENDWIGVDPDVFEWAVSVSASLAVWANDSGCVIGLSSNGAAPNMPEAIRVRPRHNPDQIVRVLESLAVLIPFAIGRFDEFLINEHRALPFGTSLIVVTPMLSEQIEIALRRLQTAGKKIVLIMVGREEKLKWQKNASALPFAMYSVPLKRNTHPEQMAI
jgi:uncharacterized protein (DUF58 family)